MNQLTQDQILDMMFRFVNNPTATEIPIVHPLAAASEDEELIYDHPGADSVPKTFMQIITKLHQLAAAVTANEDVSDNEHDFPIPTCDVCTYNAALPTPDGANTGQMMCHVCLETGCFGCGKYAICFTNFEQCHAVGCYFWESELHYDDNPCMACNLNDSTETDPMNFLCHGCFQWGCAERCNQKQHCV